MQFAFENEKMSFASTPAKWQNLIIIVVITVDTVGELAGRAAGISRLITGKASCTESVFCRKMIDIHTHVVYGIDDGAASPEMSCRMLVAAAEQGVTDILCTSHCVPGHSPFLLDAYMHHLELLRSWVEGQGLELRLWPGCEILYTEQAPEKVRRGEIPILGNGEYALVEFLPETSWDTIRKAIREFGNSGLRMVVAHVERYRCLREDLSRLEEMGSQGVLRQMNAATAIRSGQVIGDRWAKHALKQGLIDLVASDMHRIDWRPPNMGAAWEMIRKKYGSETATRLMEKNPRKLILRSSVADE